MVNASSLSQTSLDHPAETIMVADAGAFDMGFLTTTTAPVGSLTTPACVTPVTPSPWTTTPVYAGVWARKQISGTYAGGKDCIYEVGQAGNSMYATCDGSAHSGALNGKIYQVKNNGTFPVIYSMYVGAAQ